MRPSFIQCSTSVGLHFDASPKAISERTSYLQARLEFLPYPQLIRQLFNGGRFGPPVGFTQPSTWSWIDRLVSGLPHCTIALLRLAFATAPYFLLNLAQYGNSPVHSTKGTPSPLNGLWLFVSIRFQDLFHSAPAVLFTFPSRYWFTIGQLGVFRLTGWSRRIPTGLHVPRRTQDTTRSYQTFEYRTCTFYGWPFNAILLIF